MPTNTPTKYRKKPVVIEAVQWDGSVEQATVIIDWVLAGGGTATYRDHAAAPDCPGLHEAGPFRYCDQKGCDWSDEGPTLDITTLEGVMSTSPQDFVICGIKGEFYPCKPDIFAGSYDSID